MLEIEAITGDVAADGVIEAFISRRIKNIMDYIIKNYVQGFGDNDHYEALDGESPELADEAAAFCPAYLKGQPDECLKQLLDLYALICSPEAYRPSLVQYYILAALIKYAQDMLHDMKASTYMLLPSENRGYVLALAENICACLAEDLGEDEGEGDDAYSVRDFMAKFEDLDSYMETCFADWDFALLDEMDPAEIAKSDVSKDMGVEIEGSPDAPVWEVFVREHARAKQLLS